MRNETPEEVVAFEPDALELKNERLPLAVRLCVWLPVVLVSLAVIWASLAKVDVIVQGNGKLVTDLPTIVMKPLERCVIKKINVKIGDVVKKDQVLITFDPAFNMAESERLKNEIESFDALLNRLKAEFTEKQYRADANQFEKWQQAIFDRRKKYFEERITYFKEALSQIDASEKSKRDNLRKQKERLEGFLKLEGMYSTLYKKKAVALKDLIEMQISRMSMEATVDQIENDLLEIFHRKGSTVAEKNAFVQEWRNSIAEEMVTAERSLTSARKEYAKVRQLIEYVYLRSPCDAVVHEIASFSPGSAVREAEALITLIPLDGNIEVEAELRPQDIGKVEQGATGRIKLTAYPFQKHGTLTGTVVNISENTLQREVGGQNVTYYRARLSVSGKLENVKGSFRLIPGMETQCEIKCGRRRVIEYVLYPLIKALDETAREP